jgi:hypothetical protein
VAKRRDRRRGDVRRNECEPEARQRALIGALSSTVIDPSLRDLAHSQGARKERPIEEQCAADGLAAEKRASIYQFTRTNEEREMLKLGLVKPNSYARPL